MPGAPLLILQMFSASFLSQAVHLCEQWGDQLIYIYKKKKKKKPEMLFKP